MTLIHQNILSESQQSNYRAPVLTNVNINLYLLSIINTTFTITGNLRHPILGGILKDLISTGQV